MAREKVEAKKFWTTHEAARYLCVTASTIIQWAKDGKMNTIKTLGGHRRIADEEVQRIYNKMRSGNN